MKSDETVISSKAEAPCLTKAEVPWSSVRRLRLSSHKHGVLRSVLRILNKLTPENSDHLKLIHSGITTVDILAGVVSLIYHKAVREPIYCPVYAQLCSVLRSSLPSFPSRECSDKQITFTRLLLNSCQEAFERPDAHGPEQRLLKLGNIRLIGELLKQRLLTISIGHRIVQDLLGRDNDSCPKEENVEALCLLLNTFGKQLDEAHKSEGINDGYFSRLKDIAVNPEFAPRIRFMVLDVIDLRSNNWVPRREEVKPKTIAEIHMEAERDMGLPPGSTAGLSRGRT